MKREDDKRNDELFTAVESGDREKAEAAIATGANVNARKDSATPLQVAARMGDAHMVALLIENGAHTNASDRYGTTALHEAAKHGHDEIVLTLLLSRTYPNASDNFGRTPLHLAAANGYVDVISTLLDAGANPTVFDKEHRSPLSIAEKIHCDEIVKMLQEASKERASRRYSNRVTAERNDDTTPRR